jgi:hypothetical protein
MTPDEKEQKILELQAKKKVLKEEVSRAFRRSTDYYQLHKAAELKYDKLKTEYEALDREEKFLSLSITRKVLKDPKAPKQPKVLTSAQKAERAKKALDKLPSDIRARILAGFKKIQEQNNKKG